ncbi:TlpA disulfide reductase family protein [Faecalibacter macacae]|uniref:TlpA family protein disulfide reductase n=1 Tax=Faecalibacter macacae TaxID=1859289 RepID=A0A3L9M5E0_9FLAO|nr:TlpA disulfide reductase family protein [Faecalibacter macacae]RLZ06544.1 TlpA family protein disulfide reductase [Faecalibacter macacae]
MKFIKIFSLIAILGFSKINAQEVKVIKYEELFQMVNQPTDQLIAVNFWATWCGPCVEEMPHFVEVSEQYKENPNFKILFVSMDRVKQLEKVKQFINDYKINAEVVLLDDNKRMNEWIPAIDKSWSGNIPVTVFYQNGEKVHFVGQDMSKNELEQNVKTFIK